MDPSIFPFRGAPSDLRLQESKLATYMNLNSSGHPSGLPSGLSSGLPSGLSSGLPSGLSSGLPSGLSSGHPSGLPSGLTSGCPANCPLMVESQELLRMESPDNQGNPQDIVEFEIDNNIYYPQPDIQTSPPRTPENIFAVDGHIPANVQVHQENVGGTTYFFPTNNDTGANGNHGLPPLMYPAVQRRNIPVGPKAGLNSSLRLRENLKSEVLQKLSIIHSVPEIIDMTLPSSVQDYVDLCSLDTEQSSDGVIRTSTYRVTHCHTGLFYVLRRLHDFNFAFNKLPVIIEQWKKLNHPNLVQLHEVFSTKNFGDQSLICIYDYYPGSMTLQQKYMMNRVGIDETDPFNSDPDAPRPYTHQKNTILRATHAGTFMPENLIWNILVQITAGLRIVHLAGLSCWYLDPSKIIVTGSTVRISWPGVNEIIKVASCGSAGLSITTEEAQQEDLLALGRMVLGLVCQSSLPVDLRVISIYMQTITRDYSTDLKNLVMYLLSASASKPKSLTDLMPMIGARFYNFTETLQRQVHALEDQLTVEFDNKRLYKILVKLNTVVDRPGLNIDHSWAETGDRYILKLFRDYIFHSVTPEGRPWLDNAHIVNCLNNLESGSVKMIQLESRNERSVLVVSFRELNYCLERAFSEVVQAASPPSS